MDARLSGARCSLASQVWGCSQADGQGSLGFEALAQKVIPLAVHGTDSAVTVKAATLVEQATD